LELEKNREDERTEEERSRRRSDQTRALRVSGKEGSVFFKCRRSEVGVLSIAKIDPLDKAAFMSTTYE